ncbi:MAG: SEC-C metal-binding domain-containing protein, partial [Patescibacteria group bacterium]
AVVQEVKERYQKGQPVLLGTISIAKNELLSELLTQAGVPHEILNAKNHAREASIIAQAGRKGSVTLATNMAGRGVDIILGGSPADLAEAAEVKSLGGLHVIGTERHESRRIDNQLRGRGGRQGDPGSTLFYVSLEDDLMRIFGSDRVSKVMQKLGLPDDVPIENKMVAKSIETAQKKVEGHNFDIRKHLVEYDDVLNKQREAIYKKRRDILQSSESNPEKLKDLAVEMISKEINEVVAFHTAMEKAEDWNLKEIYETINSVFPISQEVRKKLDDIKPQTNKATPEVAARDSLIDYLIGLAKERYNDLEKDLQIRAASLNVTNSQSIMREAEKTLLLRAIDRLWVQHLTSMDYLRGSIGLQGYGQRDPLVEYKRQAYKMFKELLAAIQDEVVYNIFKTGLIQNLAKEQAATPKQNLQEQGPAKTMAESKSVFATALTNKSQAVVDKPRDGEGHKVGRNDPCPCGSGKKYKKCHGK